MFSVRPHRLLTREVSVGLNTGERAPALLLRVLSNRRVCSSPYRLPVFEHDLSVCKASMFDDEHGGSRAVVRRSCSDAPLALVASRIVRSSSPPPTATVVERRLREGSCRLPGPTSVDVDGASMVVSVSGSGRHTKSRPSDLSFSQKFYSRESPERIQSAAAPSRRKTTSASGERGGTW